MEVCRKNKWNYIIVLKDGSLPLVWKDAQGLMRLDTEREHYHEQSWQGRWQTFRWVNEIEHEYGAGFRKKVFLHWVICEESWEEIDPNGLVVQKTSRHAWISSEPITRKNVHERCNLAARKRWLHENNILKEKHQGYSYEHIFSHQWDAMQGYHFLMHIARMFNEMAVHSVCVIEYVKVVGIQPFIKRLREVMSHRELDAKRLRRLTKSPGQLRLIYEDNWDTRQSVA